MPNIFEKSRLNRFNAGFFSSRVGEWVYTVALNWIVLTETSSPWLLAVVNACRLAPSLLLSWPAGLWADRYCPRRLSYLNNIANAVVMLAVGLALHLKAPMLYVSALVLLQAALTALEGPFRNTYMGSLFQGRQLKAAVAHNASLMNAGRIVGPLLAGFLLTRVGGLGTFLVAALCTAVFCAAMARPEAALRRAERARAQASFSLATTLRENKAIRDILLLAVPMMFFGFPYTAMLSVLTDTLLGLGAEQLGALTAISAAGALVASGWLGLRPEHSDWAQTLRYALLFALSLCLLAGIQGFASAALVLFFVGYLGQAYRSCSRMHLHEVLPPGGAGQILGLSLMDRGMIPLGGLLLGAVTEFAGPRAAYALMGIGCFLTALFFLARAREVQRES